MQYVTVGPKYQIVIPKEIRKKVKGIKPGAKVMVGEVNEDTISVKPLKQNWSDANYGVLQKYWKGKDMVKEVEKIRDEWEAG